VGACCVVVAAGYLLAALDLERGTLASSGPGFFPVIVGVAFLVISVLTVVETIRSAPDDGDVLPPAEQRRTVALFLVLTAGYVLLLPSLGQYLAASIFVVLVLKLLGVRTWIHAVGFGVVIAVLVSGFFIELLGVRMPEGLLEGLT
jgi:putative tricarboxylic transport membrane protein